jgi:2-haloacid dehalogenase
MPPEVAALLFDTYGTVVDWRTPVLAALADVGRARGLSMAWEQVMADWEPRSIQDRVNAGALPWMTMEQIHRRAATEALARHGVTDLSPEEIDRLVHARWALPPWPDSVPGLTRLKRRYVISPLSNASFMGMVRLAKFAGLPWDCIITAENARRYKPAPEAYRTALGLLGLPATQVMLVAAHNYDLRAARGEGLRTAFVPRPTEYGPGQTTDLGPESDWDVVARDFVDLAEKLGA